MFKINRPFLSEEGGFLLNLALAYGLVSGYHGRMALKSTIYKINMQIADMDRHYYADHALTIASHPSENEERMMARLLAFALNAHERLEFANGLTDQDEPDIWLKSLTGDIEQWIMVGQPDEKAILKACGRSGEVKIYSHRSTVGTWWAGISGKLERARNLSVFKVDDEAIENLAKMADRSMNLLYTIQDGEVWVRNDKDGVQVAVTNLSQA